MVLHRTRGNISVYIVEDSPVSVDSLKRLLSEIDRLTVIGHSGRVPEAIEAIERYHPDVVVLDLDLNGGDGIEILPSALECSIVVILASLIDAESRQNLLDAGARFVFDKTEGLESLAEAMRQLSVVRAPDTGLRVLVADDNAINRKLVDSMLRRLGIQADFVLDGGAAVEAALRNRYALVLMDLQMPVLDGYEAARAIRDREGTASRVPIIAVTANGRDIDAGRHLDAGMDDYLEKPLSLARLQETLERWLPGQPS